MWACINKEQWQCVEEKLVYGTHRRKGCSMAQSKYFVIRVEEIWAFCFIMRCHERGWSTCSKEWILVVQGQVISSFVAVRRKTAGSLGQKHMLTVKEPFCCTQFGTQAKRCSVVFPEVEVCEEVNLYWHRSSISQEWGEWRRQDLLWGRKRLGGMERNWVGDWWVAFQKLYSTKLGSLRKLDIAWDLYGPFKLLYQVVLRFYLSSEMQRKPNLMHATQILDGWEMQHQRWLSRLGCKNVRHVVGEL